MSNVSHRVPTQRRVTIVPFHVVCWVLAIVLGFLALKLTANLVVFVVTVMFILVWGIPITDDITVHARIGRWIASTRNRKDRGVMLAHPLRRQGKSQSSCLPNMQIVTATGLSAGGALSTLPLLSYRGDTLTVVMDRRGASRNWSGGDRATKFAEELLLVEALARALSALPKADIFFVQARTFHPANREDGIRYNRTRLNPQLTRAAAAQAPHDDTDPQPVRDAYACQDGLTSLAGETQYYSAVTMHWPRVGFLGRRKLNLSDPHLFMNSDIWRLARLIVDAYLRNDVDAAFMDHLQLAELAAKVVNPGHQWGRQLRLARDEEMARVGVIKPERDTVFPLPLSVATDTKDHSGWICVNGVWIAAAYVSSVARPDLPAGLQDEMLDFGGEFSFTAGTVSRLLRADKVRRRGAAREVVVKGFDAQLPFQHLSRPEIDDAIRKAEAARRELHNSGSRPIDSYHLLVIYAGSLEELELYKRDAEFNVLNILSLQWLTKPEDIEDAMVALLGQDRR